MPFCIYSLGFYLFPLFLLHFLVLFKKKKGCRVQSSFGDTVYYVFFMYCLLFCVRILSPFCRERMFLKPQATFIFLLTFTLSHYNNTDRVKIGACWTTGSHLHLLLQRQTPVEHDNFHFPVWEVQSYVHLMFAKVSSKTFP